MTDKQPSGTKKPDLRDKSGPPTSLRNTDLKSPLQNVDQGEESGPDVARPGVEGQAEGQTTHE